MRAFRSIQKAADPHQGPGGSGVEQVRSCRQATPAWLAKSRLEEKLSEEARKIGVVWA